MLTLVSIALAHHDTAVSQVGTAPTLPTPGFTQDRGPRLEFAVASSVASYTRTLRGSKALRGYANAVTQSSLTPVARMLLPSGTGFELAVPLAVVGTKSPLQDTELRGGMGDLSVAVSQRLGGFVSRVGLQAPTGPYDPEPVVSVLDLTSGDGRLTTYDVRTGLGSGAWTAQGGLAGSWNRERFGIDGTLDGWVPFTKTPDAIRWGPTLGATLGTTFAVHRRLRLGLGADARHHLPDRWIAADEDTGLPTEAQAGRRSAIGASLQALATLGRAQVLGLQVHAPLWQHVQGVQLTERIAARLTWQVAVPLKARTIQSTDALR